MMLEAIKPDGVIIIVAALPPVARQTGTPRASAPRVPMGTNAGAPNNPAQQTEILKETLKLLVSIDSPGKIVPLAIEYNASV